MAAFSSISARAFVALAMVFAACVLSDMTPAAAADGTVFDELRFGVTTSLADRNGGGEDGVFPAFTAYFDPFASASAVTFGEKLPDRVCIWVRKSAPRAKQIPFTAVSTGPSISIRRFSSTSALAACGMTAG